MLNLLGCLKHTHPRWTFAHFERMPSVLTAILFMFSAATSHIAWAQETANPFPFKPIHLVVPFPAGGSADLVARIIAKPLAEKLGQAVLIDNKPGADGELAAQAVMHAPADGHTLFMATYGAMSAVPSLHKQPSYNPLKDFTPIAETGVFSMFLFVHDNTGVRTIQELIAYERQHPGEVNYATGNVASIVMSAELNSAAQMHMVHVPYKGEVQALGDFVTGRIHVMFATPVNALPFVKEGKLHAIATLSESRNPLLPEVPTWHEAGMRDFPIVPWSGIFGPAHMSPDTAKQLSRAINEVLHSQDVIEAFAKLGFEAHGSTPSKLQAFATQQLNTWHSAIQNAGLSPE